MTKLFLFIAAIGLGFSSSAQQGIQVEVSGNIFNSTTDTVKIAQYFGGTNYKDLLVAKRTKKGDYIIKGKLPAPDYYVFRLGNQHINVILRDKSVIRLNADGSNLNQYSTISGSDETVALNDFVTNLTYFNSKRDSAAAMMQAHPEDQAAINQSYQSEYLKFSSIRSRFIAEHQNSAALIPVLSTLDLDKEWSIYETVATQLIAGFEGSPTIESIKQQYATNKAQHDAKNLLSQGKEAPDFTQNDVNGAPMSLSSLRGKVVLLDFWASWCGPCRKENPNVVALYKKYKDAGFTVMSVSLDKDKAPWLAAIEKDGLIWPNHVSDLGYWSNAVAKQYQVSSIPFTVLINREGKIINTKLRGYELEQVLQGIFGF